MPSPSKKISVLLADDHAIIRKGLRLLLEDETDIRIVAEAGDGRSAIAGVRDHAPDVVVMDISMPDVNGIEAARHITTTFPGTKVIALSIHSGRQFIKDMLSAGAVGYILKESAPEEIIEGIRAVMRGEIFLSAAVTETVVAEMVDGRSKTPKDVKADRTLAKMADEKAIIYAKLHRPPMPVDHVKRTRLLTALDQGRNRPLTLISAPAGYGKSTLASCWLETLEGSTAWLSLDTHDDDLHSFLVYLLAAIETMFPDAVPKTSALTSASDPLKLPVLAASLLNELGRIEQDVILVLDDLHLLRDASVYQLLGKVIQNLPSRMHLVLIGRRDPFLPIANLRARGQVTEIRATDLRFRATETAAYLQQIYDAETEDAVAAEWTEKTEGWITGLRLAALAMGHQGDIRVLPDQKDNSHYVREYLFEEVFSNQRPLMRRWLACTSILDRFCPGLCEAVIGEDTTSDPDAMDGWQFITRLKDDNLFIINLDSDNHWFRYHHMFQQLLHNQLKRRQSPEEIALLHHRASQWFEHQGLIDEAIWHALSADDETGVVRLVKQNRHAMYDNEKWFAVEKWLSQIPEGVIRNSPELLLSQTWASYYRADFAHILPTVDAAETLLSNEPQDQPLLGEIDLFRGVFCYMQGHGKRSLSYFEDALQRIPQKYQMVRGFSEMYFGMAGQMVGQLERVVSYLSDQLDNPSLAMSRKIRSRTALVWIHLISGDLNAAHSLNTQLQHMAGKEKSAIFKTWSFYNQGLIHFYRNELDAARRHFHQAAETRFLVLRRASVDCLAGLALTCQAMHQTDKASDAIGQLLGNSPSFEEDPAMIQIVDSCKARLSLMRGESVSVAGLSDFTGHAPDVGAMAIWLEIPAITQCRVLLAEGSDASLQEAEEKLQVYWTRNQAHHNTLQTIGILVLLTIVRHRQGQLEASLDVLEQAIALAEPGGVMRPFVEAGPSMAALLEQLQPQKNAVSFIAKLRADLADDASVVPEPTDHPVAVQNSPQPLVEHLTNRELDILELLAQRMQNKEIADQLFISTETVKSHLKNIYQKLDTGNRREAVQKARRLGLRPS
jgi:LuxR family maltose regulon positive regulatory protein